MKRFRSLFLTLILALALLVGIVACDNGGSAPKTNKLSFEMNGHGTQIAQQVLKEDEKVNNSIWNMDFQPENFCQYVFTNIMALLQSGEANCRFFIYLLEHLLYE